MIGTLAAMALPALQNLKDKANVARAIEEIRTLEIEIMGYQADDQQLPATLGDINRGSLLDPWGNPYEYLNFELASGGKGKGKGKGAPAGARKDRFLVPINSTYDLYSMGKDGESVPALTAKVSRDDIVRASDGSFVGLAVKY